MSINLIFKEGTILEKLEKCRIIDNMRMEIESKVLEGIKFSNESTLALAVFPKSEIETFFAIKSNQIIGCVDKWEATNSNFKNAGYAIPSFHHSRYYDLSIYEDEELEEKSAEQKSKKDWICYCISEYELEKIGWESPKKVPEFVIEVFKALNCMPDEITN